MGEAGVVDVDAGCVGGEGGYCVVPFWGDVGGPDGEEVGAVVGEDAVVPLFCGVLGERAEVGCCGVTEVLCAVDVGLCGGVGEGLGEGGEEIGFDDVGAVDG